jgi:hypothetical protein
MTLESRLRLLLALRGTALLDCTPLERSGKPIDVAQGAPLQREAEHHTLNSGVIV